MILAMVIATKLDVYGIVFLIGKSNDVIYTMTKIPIKLWNVFLFCFGWLYHMAILEFSIHILKSSKNNK